MKEKPILFSGSMVRAIFDDRKSQTRRITKPQPPTYLHGRHPFHVSGNVWGLSMDAEPPRACSAEDTIKAPYMPGDRLWVRETHAYVDHLYDGVDRDDPIYVAYRADETVIQHTQDWKSTEDTNSINWGRVKWRPSIFMPRWACRLELDVVDVRMEWLQDIAENDAQTEGWDLSNIDVTLEYLPEMNKATEWFLSLWDSINAKRGYPWKSNPLVWVVEFKMAETL